MNKSVDTGCIAVSWHRLISRLFGQSFSAEIDRKGFLYLCGVSVSEEIKIIGSK